MKRKWKIVLGVIIVLIFLAIVVLDHTKAVEANVLQVVPRTIAKTFIEEGKIVPETEQAVYSRYPGTITNLAVEEGQKVKKGQLLAVLDSKELDYQARVNELQIEQAQRSLEAAEADFNRVEQLYNASALSQKEYEDAKYAVEEAKNNLELQRALIEIPQYQKGKYTITSPLDGIVGDIKVEKSETVNPQMPMMNIYKTDSFLVEVFILTADVPSIGKGMKVDLIREKGAQKAVYCGTVTKITPSAEEKESALGLAEQRVKVLIEPENTESLELFPGYNLDVEFSLDKIENVLVVPKAAIFPYKGGEALWVVKNGKAEIRKIAKGEDYNSQVVIIKGLNAGDEVILNPQLEGLKEGKKIAISK